jgi:hypothetical protein
MNNSEIELIGRAIALLQELMPDGMQRPGRPASRPCPVLDFARRYLMHDAGGDVTSDELWQFYKEVAAAREVEPLTQRSFQQALPAAMEAIYGTKKCHSIRRAGGTVRGFKSVSIREEACPASTMKTEPD